MTIDAKAKATRNRQWEEAFGHIQEALDISVQDSTADTEVFNPPQSERTKPNDATLPIDDTPEVASQHIQVLWNDVVSLDQPTLQWPANTGRDLVRHNLPPQSLWAPETMQLTALRRRHTWKKLAMQELSTGLMIHNLIKHVKLVRFLRSALNSLRDLSPHILEIASFSEDEVQCARNDLVCFMEKVHVTNVNSSPADIATARIRPNLPGIPRYFQDADGDFHGICKQMNNGIGQLLHQQANSKGNDREKAITVAKICHNLLVSTAAPNLATFNLLLSGFTLWRATSLVDDIIAAFLASKIRPDELACRLILNHYTVQCRPEEFSRFVARMRGFDGALMLANPAISVNGASEGRLVRDENCGQKIYQKVYPTPMVFAALIAGVVKFAGFNRALDIYYEMKADGWGLDVPALTKLLGDCIRRVDWEGGMYIWEEINSTRMKARPTDMTKAYSHMISLCSLTGNTVAFNQILNEVTRHGFDRRAILLAAMKTTQWAQNKKTWTAPAFAADNLMIAVSDYATDARMDGVNMEEPLLEIIEAKDKPSMGPSHQGRPGSDTETSNGPLGDNPVDSKEAWSLWVEHEFGKRPEDPEM